MRLETINKIASSILAGEGMTNTGTLCIQRAFGEHRIGMLCLLNSRRVPYGQEERLTALAFAVTQPRSMRPPSINEITLAKGKVS